MTTMTELTRFVLRMQFDRVLKNPESTSSDRSSCRFMQKRATIPCAARPVQNVARGRRALRKLAEFDERKSRALELKFSGGITMEEISKALGISGATAATE
jgi:hypothetical protein